MNFERSRMLLSVAAIKAVSAMFAVVAHSPNAGYVPPRKIKVRADAHAGSCNLSIHSSLRKRMRAARRGSQAVTEPSEAALMRHPWYRKKKAWDALRARTA